jgi:hypothetical protein
MINHIIICILQPPYCIFEIMPHSKQFRDDGDDIIDLTFKLEVPLFEELHNPYNMLTSRRIIRLVSGYNPPKERER